VGALKLVLDTHVVASAMLWGGPPRQLLDAQLRGTAQLFSSLSLLEQLTRILGRRKFAAKLQVAEMSIDELVEAYGRRIQVVRPAPIDRVAPDPDDDMVLATAMSARADLIVTGDIALRSLKVHHGIALVDVASALAHPALR
jgi:uncharacterized protein